MENDRSLLFKWVVRIIFIIFIFVGFVVFVTYKPVNKIKEEIGKVVIWGTLNKSLISKILSDLALQDPRFANVKYIQKSKKTFNHDILEALAQQKSPDLILVSYQDFITNSNKIEKIPYSYLSKRDFYNTFVDAFDIYLDKDGFWGIPFLIDPMVLYYNKTIFANNGVVEPPKYWEEFEEPNGIVKKTRVIDENNNLVKAAIALGEGLNIKHFREILYTLFLQGDNGLIGIDGNNYWIKFNNTKNAVKAIKFFFEFSNPANRITYTWNKSFNLDQNEFLGENLAIYLGFVSEIKPMRLKNPNLNFDVAEIPSFRDSKNKSVFARTWVWVIPKTSLNKRGAYLVAMRFSEPDIQQKISNRVYLPPIRKDILAKPPVDDPYMNIFYREALYSKSILEPGRGETKKVFLDFISNVQTGFYSPIDSLNYLIKQLSVLVNKK